MKISAPNVTPKELPVRRAFSVVEIAESLRISTGLVRLEIARGKLKARRIGRRLVIPVESLNEWLGRDE
jgi:excisionase family DNA binding protein